MVEWVRRGQDGEELAISKLITMHKGLIYTIIMRMVNNMDVAQELTHDTFVKAFSKIRGLRVRERFRPWLCTIARHTVLDYLRKEKGKRTVSIEELAEPADPADASRIRSKAVIQDALSRLTERDRMLLVLAYYKGFSLEEVAETMKIPKVNIKVYIQRARDRLRELLKGCEDELMP